MSARNARVNVIPRYTCHAALYTFGDPQCQGVSATAVDRLIESLVLKAVEPAALELSIRAAGELERDRERLHEQWKQKLERVGYEVAGPTSSMTLSTQTTGWWPGNWNGSGRQS